MDEYRGGRRPSGVQSGPSAPSSDTGRSSTQQFGFVGELVPYPRRLREARRALARQLGQGAVADGGRRRADLRREAVVWLSTITSGRIASAPRAATGAGLPLVSHSLAGGHRCAYSRADGPDAGMRAAGGRCCHDQAGHPIEGRHRADRTVQVEADCSVWWTGLQPRSLALAVQSAIEVEMISIIVFRCSSAQCAAGRFPYPGRTQLCW